MLHVLPRYPIAIVRGNGCRMWDADGKEYLDLFSGFGAGVLGHCHPDLVDAVEKQARQVWHVGNLLHTEPQVRLAEAIQKHGFGGQSFFCHSGADANEAAFKMARAYGRHHPGLKGPRYKIISATQSFHGRSFATMMATGQDKVRIGFEPWLPGFVNVPYDNLSAIEGAIDDETIAIIVEPIQGEGGINVPHDTYLHALRRLCNERDMVLIFDEVWTGVGRTGKYFAHQHWNVDPDIMTLAKGVGGGLALGVMCAGPRVAGEFDHKKQGKVMHATTLGGNCVTTAVAARIFEVLERDKLVAHADAMGKFAMDRVGKMIQSVPGVKSVRGKGLFIGIELDPAVATGDRKVGTWFKNASDVVNKCLDRGLLINNAQTNVLRLAPSLVVTREEITQGLDILESVLRG